MKDNMSERCLGIAQYAKLLLGDVPFTMTIHTDPPFYFSTKELKTDAKPHEPS